MIKLQDKHAVTKDEIIQCFANRTTDRFLEDKRENHKTIPPTLWFVAETNHGRKLKVVFVQRPDGCIDIKTAYIANPVELRIYAKYK